MLSYPLVRKLLSHPKLEICSALNGNSGAEYSFPEKILPLDLVITRNFPGRGIFKSGLL